MKRALVTFTAGLVLASAGLALAPLASAAEEKTLRPTQEAWYQIDPTCVQATGCVIGMPLPVPLPVQLPDALPVNPYPAGTMHVAVSGGAESSRSYVKLPLATLPPVLRSAQFTVPIDASPVSGTLLPDTAKVLACLFFDGNLATSPGSLAIPPETFCNAAPTFTYAATPSPRLGVDLAPLLDRLPFADGIALIPLVTDQSEAWHVAFSAHDRADAAAPPAPSLVVQAGVVSTPTDDPSETTPTDAPPVANGPDLGIAPAPLPNSSLPSFTPTPGIAPPPAVVANPVSSARILRRPLGSAYPVLFYLPVVLLLLVPLAGQVLTANLETPSTRKRSDA